MKFEPGHLPVYFVKLKMDAAIDAAMAKDTANLRVSDRGAER